MSRPWRGLTVIQPWAWLISTSAKRVENRTWAPPASWRGPLLIHAGKAPVMDLSPELRALPWPQDMGVTGYTLGAQLDRMARRGEFVVGHVVAVADGVEARQGTECPACDGDGWVASHGFSGPERDGCPVDCRGQRDQFAFGPVCWWLSGVRALREPVPCRGMQGLWTPAPEVVVQVEELLRGR